ncbi:MAG: D-2-hydroxyacid dehydrogenase [Clostridiaceae bacterium]|jgi:phosphoglycerate dehydrogenase-like enzyme|nr:D-2-hydroxyacid dehydrogenase [Clostridiaceae bacterium]
MAEINKVLVLLPVTEEHKKLFRKEAPSAEFIFISRNDIKKEMLENTDVIIGNPPIGLIKEAKELKWIHLGSAGADMYVNKGVLPSGTILTNSSGAYGLAVAEYMLAVLLELFYNLHLYRDNQNHSLWKDEGSARSIHGCVVLIIGLGDIGGEFAKRIKALGGYTIGIRRTKHLKPDYVDELYLTDQLDTLLPRADAVAITLPGTRETYRLFSSERLKKMKPGAVIINTGRGTTIDTDALCDCLESGHLAGAALDVTDPEPLPAGHRLWKMKNAIITPHIAGGIHLPETFERIIRISVENLRRYKMGEELLNIVNPVIGY